MIYASEFTKNSAYLREIQQKFDNFRKFRKVQGTSEDFGDLREIQEPPHKFSQGRLKKFKRLPIGLGSIWNVEILSKIIQRVLETF